MSGSKKKASSSMVGLMNTERPLDALLPELSAPDVLPIPLTPVHQRVLVSEVDGGAQWLFCCWQDPGSQQEFHRQIMQVVEATLLAELSQNGRRLRKERQKMIGMELVVYPELPYALEPALKAFGFQRSELDASAMSGRLSVLKDEAKRMGVTLRQEPRSLWTASIDHRQGALGETLLHIEKTMAERIKLEVWGENPGTHSHLFATLIAEHFGEEITPDLKGLSMMEMYLVSKEQGGVRWIPPMLFQALCDFIGIALNTVYGLEVAWSLCEEDPSGLTPPPIFQVRRKDGSTYHIPIAHHLLRWCQMPIAPGEQVPSLVEWIADQARA